jgi:hypothetical protein
MGGKMKKYKPIRIVVDDAPLENRLNGDKENDARVTALMETIIPNMVQTFENLLKAIRAEDPIRLDEVTKSCTNDARYPLPEGDLDGDFLLIFDGITNDGDGDDNIDCSDFPGISALTTLCVLDIWNIMFNPRAGKFVTSRFETNQPSAPFETLN